MAIILFFRNVKYIYAINDEEAKEKYKKWFYIEHQPVFTGKGNWNTITEGVNLDMENKYVTMKEETIKIRKREINVGIDKLCKNMHPENFRNWFFDGMDKSKYLSDDNIEETTDELKQMWFTDDKYNKNSDDSCNYHAMTHMDTEILGVFCDMTAIHGDGLKDVLTRGYLARILR